MRPIDRGGSFLINMNIENLKQRLAIKHGGDLDGLIKAIRLPKRSC